LKKRQTVQPHSSGRQANAAVVARDDERIDDSSEIVSSGEIQQRDRPGISIDLDLGDVRACAAGEVCRIIKRRLVEAGFDRIDRIIVRHIGGQGDLRERHGPVGARDGERCC
jgi:hypothetical protein